MNLSRSRAAALGQEADRILADGHYVAPSGRRVDIADLVRRAVEGTVAYPHDEPAPALVPGSRPTQIEVVNETTLSAASRLVAQGHRPVALNFASARHPGGGYRSGARAQEESLARSSGLVACLLGRALYDVHNAVPGGMYTSYALYSPGVPVFRNDDGDLLNEPYLCAFITAPAVNAKVVLERDRSARPAIRAAMEERVGKVLAIAVAHGHDAAVLGAWGCGVFGNDTEEVAGLFRQALDGPARGVFDRVVFAVTDWSDEQRFIGPFRRAFATR
jgi:uncharacterized protein (TIGR02452 family)